MVLFRVWHKLVSINNEMTKRKFLGTLMLHASVEVASE